MAKFKPLTLLLNADFPGLLALLGEKKRFTAVTLRSVSCVGSAWLNPVVVGRVAVVVAVLLVVVVVAVVIVVVVVVEEGSSSGSV